VSVEVPTNHGASEDAFAWRSLATGEWIVKYTNAQQRRLLHYWFTILWLTAGVLLWMVLRNDLWFVGVVSLYAIWVTHLAGWAAESPVEAQDEDV
jgi:hypothetical protein